MKLRSFSQSLDLPRLNEWWRARASVDAGFDPRLLASGWVVEAADKPLAMGFLHRTDSGMAWLSFVAGEPSAQSAERSAALDLLIAHLIREARGQGFLWIMATTNVPALEQRYARHGFAPTDKGVVHLVRKL